jgi:hypothetical protein
MDAVVKSEIPSPRRQFGILKNESRKYSRVVSMLNQVPQHEDVFESTGIAPRILYLGTGWR